MVVGATEKGAVDYTEIDYTVPVAVVMGNEETGISDEVLRHCDRLASIPDGWKYRVAQCVGGCRCDDL